MKLSDYVMKFITRQGVKHIFMLPGGGAMHLNDSAGHTPGLDFVCNLHEQACAVAAEAYARVTGHLGVALVTTGPGGTNAVTGVAAAWLDSTPCIFISGQVKRADLVGTSGVRQSGLQELDIVKIVGSITKYAVTVTEPTDIRYHMERAVYMARSGRPGPVWIDIPLDVQAAELQEKSLKGFKPPPSERDALPLHVADMVRECARKLMGAKRPVLLAGNGVRLSGAERQLMELVGRLRVPVLTTRLGVDLVPASCEFLMGMPGSLAPRAANFTVQNADWLLVLGARLDSWITAYSLPGFAKGAAKYVVDLDPAELGRIRDHVEMGIPADVGTFLSALLGTTEDSVLPDWSDWSGICQGWKGRYPLVLPAHRERRSGISTYEFAECMSDMLDGGDVILPGSSGVACEIFLTAFKAKAGQRVFHNKGTGAMGLGQAAGIGACLGAGRRRTICVDGDGGFHMNSQELETVRRLSLPIKFFVLNNDGYASIRASQGNYFKRLTGADTTSGLSLPSIGKLTSAYGILYFSIQKESDLPALIGRVLSFPGPAVCEVFIEPNEERMPRVVSYQLPDGSMASKPLEDLWPFLDRDELAANMFVSSGESS